jgi:hypothetical protein
MQEPEQQLLMPALDAHGLFVLAEAQFVPAGRFAGSEGGGQSEVAIRSGRAGPGGDVGGDGAASSYKNMT